MEGEMDVDTPEQRGEKRPVEEADVSGPPKPKRIKVRAPADQAAITN